MFKAANIPNRTRVRLGIEALDNVPMLFELANYATYYDFFRIERESQSPSSASSTSDVTQLDQLMSDLVQVIEGYVELACNFVHRSDIVVNGKIN